MWLKSDNIAGADAAILRAMADCNAGTAGAYGGDAESRRLDGCFSALFEHEVRVFPVPSGTAANALSLASLAGPFGLIACHEDAHPLRSESGATTFFSGGAGFVPVAGVHGRFDARGLADALDALSGGGHGALSAAAITVTQLSEAGTAYGAEEIRAIGAVAKQRGLSLHMDGARFANALAGQGARPADLTWRCGVDVMSFGGTKNGTMYADAVIFFDPGRSRHFEQRLKRAGHALSKTRFLAAQLLAYVEGGRWLANARHANAMAQRVAQLISATPSGELLHPVEGNVVFAALGEDAVARLEAAGFNLRPKGRLDDGRRLFRMVASFATTAAEVERFGAALAI
jgi:threonine aldolase